MKTKVTTIGALLVAANAAFGAVSINFSDDFSSGVPQNFSNAAGVPTNGLVWGIVVDGSNNGLLTTPNAYGVPSLLAGSSTVLSLAAGGLTDDVLYISTSGLTQSTASNTEGDAVTTGGVGGIYDISGVAFANGVGANDKFYVVWFQGNVAGTLTDVTFVMPSDGANATLAAPFIGVDPIRRAGLAYVGDSGTSTGAGISFVPEPSAALLGAIGALGLLRRRRI